MKKYNYGHQLQTTESTDFSISPNYIPFIRPRFKTRLGLFYTADLSEDLRASEGCETGSRKNFPKSSLLTTLTTGHLADPFGKRDSPIRKILFDSITSPKPNARSPFFPPRFYTNRLPPATGFLCQSTPSDSIVCIPPKRIHQQAHSPKISISRY